MQGSPLVQIPHPHMQRLQMEISLYLLLTVPSKTDSFVTFSVHVNSNLLFSFNLLYGHYIDSLAGPCPNLEYHCRHILNYVLCCWLRNCSKKVSVFKVIRCWINGGLLYAEWEAAIQQCGALFDSTISLHHQALRCLSVGHFKLRELYVHCTISCEI